MAYAEHHGAPSHALREQEGPRQSCVRVLFGVRGERVSLRIIAVGVHIPHSCVSHGDHVNALEHIGPYLLYAKLHISTHRLDSEEKGRVMSNHTTEPSSHSTLSSLRRPSPFTSPCSLGFFCR